MANKLGTQISAWLSGLVFCCIFIILLYTNFGPRQNFSIFLPIAYLKEFGLDPAIIKTLRHNSDKLGHVVAGLILTITLFFALRPFPRLGVLFSKKSGAALFLILVSFAELGQYLTRLIACDITNTCSSMIFSLLDIAAGFLGCLMALCIIWLCL